MKVTIICGACKALLGTDIQENSQRYAWEHFGHCTATQDEYEAAIYNVKFRAITEELDL